MKQNGLKPNIISFRYRCLFGIFGEKRLMAFRAKVFLVKIECVHFKTHYVTAMGAGVSTKFIVIILSLSCVLTAITGILILAKGRFFHFGKIVINAFDIFI